jgi:hypothetical protein
VQRGIKLLTKREPRKVATQIWLELIICVTCVQVDWSAELYAKRIKRMDPSYFLLQVSAFL